MSEEAVADIAVVGLAVMGQNLILNMNDKGFVVSFAFSNNSVKLHLGFHPKHFTESVTESPG